MSMTCWIYINFHGYHVPSSSKDFQEFPMIFHGFPRISYEFPINFHGFPRISYVFPINFHGISIHFARESQGFPQCSPFRRCGISGSTPAFSAAVLAASARGGRAPVRSVAKVAPAMEALSRENDDI